MRWLTKILPQKQKRVDPEAAARHLARGVALAHKGQLEGALEAYREAQQAHPDEPLAWLNEGLALQDLYNRRSSDLEDEERAERLRAIEAAAATAVRLDPGQVIGWRTLGHVARRLGDYVRAEESFREVISRADDGFPHLEEAERELKSVSARAERQRIFRRAVALALHRDADLTDARELMETLQPLLLHPEAPTAGFWAAGVLMRRLEDKATARELFEVCVERSPRHLDARRELATLCMQAGDVDKALEHSLEAYREDPSNPALVCNVGVCHLALGNLAQAEEFLHMARGLAPNDPIVQRALSALAGALSPASAEN
jgi:tetratricopeptide (TPR) repeat protein